MNSRNAWLPGDMCVFKSEIRDVSVGAWLYVNWKISSVSNADNVVLSLHDNIMDVHMFDRMLVVTTRINHVLLLTRGGCGWASHDWLEKPQTATR